MKRRTFFAHAVGVTVVLPTMASAQSGKRAHVGWLSSGDSDLDWSLFRKAMSGLGWIEGQTIDYEYRSAASDLSRIDALAADLVDLRVDVIVAYFTPAITAARKATKTIPIVFTGGAIDAGMVGSLAHPAGNMIGTGRGGTILGAKCVQLIRDALPSAHRIAALCNAPDPYSVPFRGALKEATRTEGFQFEAVMINVLSELQPAFDRLANHPPDALVVQPSLPGKDVARLALDYRLAAVSPGPAFAEQGGLFAYFADQADVERTVAGYTSRILKGAKIADLPVQEASRFRLEINQKTASALGLTVPPIVLAQADRVIE